MDELHTEEQPQVTPTPDENSSLYVCGVIKITDPDSNEVYLEQRD